jgi:hypothetical protein
MKSVYVLILSTILVLSGSFAEEKHTNSKYINEEYKFSMKPPIFTNSISSHYVLAAFMAPAEKSFSANMNIQVLSFSKGLNEYIKNMDQQLMKAGKPVIKKKIFQMGKSQTVEYQLKDSTPSGIPLRHLVWTIDRGDYLLVFECSSLESNYEENEKKLRDSLQTIELKP